MEVFTHIILGTLLIYSVTIIWFISGNLFSSAPPNTHLQIPVSVVVAVRDGGNSLPRLLDALSNQDYKGDMEFILVDDESTDNTSKLIKEKTAEDDRFILESSTTGDFKLSRKKRALDAGIKIAQHEWLLFTDVDCLPPISWVRSMAACFSEDSDFVVGSSVVPAGFNLITWFQSMDFFLLMVAARGAIQAGRAWGSSGQNQAYRKSLYEKVGGFTDIYDEIQGDDSLFLQICRNKGKAKIHFNSSSEARVISRQEKTIGGFLRQRIRWSGDANHMWKYNPVFYMAFAAAFLLSLGLTGLLLMGVTTNLIFLTVCVKIMFLKFILEFLLYFIGSRQLGEKMQFSHFCYWFLCHDLYISCMGIASFFAINLGWKRR
ncbi:MAG: glycosyltransferase [Candidatus Marinimicrobia bacterium]|nr:glycosyltransferase [Candidatus Neomarinimicrobiota bacterium]